jgi:hypothetical protein
MVEKKKSGRPKVTTSPILEHNTALVLELHRRHVDNTNIARIVGVTPPTVTAFIKHKSVQATPWRRDLSRLNLAVLFPVFKNSSISI